jgi:iron complex transport system ATP-binding protein
VLEARDIEVSLSGRRIVHGVGFIARPGEVTVIVGPNGSGKTTLFRALCGDVAYAGAVAIDGADLRQLSKPALALRRAVLPQ